jgi:hypothetical protein
MINVTILPESTTAYMLRIKILKRKPISPLPPISFV